MRFKSSLARGASTAALAFGMALMLTGPASAADDATLRGHVDNASAGTMVTAVDKVTGHRTTATVDKDGNYIFLGLRPSNYSVEVQGRASQETTLSVGQTVDVDFTSATGVKEVVIKGRRTRQEIVTQTVSTNVTPEMIETLPQNARNFLSFASLAPGIQLSNPSGAVQIQAGALSPDQTNVFIDGISYKNLTNHGGVFGQNFGQGGNPFPQIAIQEYQIETQSFGAETGQAGSAVINAITKTGGNDFHGSVFGEFQPNDFIEQPYFDKIHHAKKPTYNRTQYGGEIGGPIIKDKLTFYFGYEGVTEDLPGATSMLPNLPDPGHPVTGYPSNVVSAITGVPHSFNFHQDLYFGKLTWYATDHDTVNFEAYVRGEKNLSDIDQNAAPTHARDIYTAVETYQMSWRHSAGNLLNILNIATNHSTQSTPTVGSGPEFNLTNYDSNPPSGPPNPDNFNPGSGAELGAHFFTQADSQKSLTFKDDLTYRWNDHKFKLGGQAIFNTLSRQVSNAYYGRYYFQNPGAGAGNFDPTTAIPYGADISTLPFNALTGKDNQVGFYAQDEWRPDEHWTVNLGLRWDMETNGNNNDYVTPPNIVAALKAYVPWQVAGINPDNYISTGSNRKVQMDEFQPRLGVSYDVHGDKDLVLFAGYGRYYDRSMFIEGAIEALTNNSLIPRVYFNSVSNPCPAGVSICIPWDPSLINPNNLRAALPPLTGGSVWLLNNNTPAPYSDEVDIGFRKRLPFGIQSSVTLSYVDSHNIFQFVRGNRLPDGTYTSGGLGFIEDGFPACGQLGWNGVGWDPVTKTCGAGASSTYSGKLNIGESNGEARLWALYVQLDKPFTPTARWGFVSSLTIQSARTNDATPSIFNNDEFFNGGDQRAYGWGNVAGVPRWIWNTSAEYRFPWDIVGSATLNLNSGPSFGHIVFAAPPGACCYANFNGVYWPKDPIGYKRLDLAVSKTFKMPYLQGNELTIYAQGYNVFNWLNRTYSAWGAGSGAHPSLQEDGQVGNDQREFQAGVKYKF